MITFHRYFLFIDRLSYTSMLTYLTLSSTCTYRYFCLLTALLSDTGDYFSSLLTSSSGINYRHIRLTYTGMFTYLTIGSTPPSTSLSPNLQSIQTVFTGLSMTHL